MKHYVYKLEDKNTGEFYYGSRTCKCKIEEDNYMGSMATWKPNKENLVKTIIKEDFKSRNSATKYEKDIIKKFINHELNRNFSIPGEHSYKIGYVTVKDKDGNYHWIHNEDERYLSGELVGVTKGIPTPDERKELISKTIKTNMSNLTKEEKNKKFGNPGKSNPMFGVKRTEKWKIEQKKRMVEYYQENEAGNKGRKFSKEWRNNMSEGRKKLMQSDTYKHPHTLGNIKVIDLDGNETVYDTVNEASRILQLDRGFLSKHIKNNTSYQRGKYKGWIFEIIK